MAIWVLTTLCTVHLGLTNKRTESNFASKSTNKMHFLTYFSHQRERKLSLGLQYGVMARTVSWPHCPRLLARPQTAQREIGVLRAAANVHFEDWDL